jgi:uncharacterized protein
VRFLAFLAFILTLTALAWLLVGVHVEPLVPGGWLTIAAVWGVSVVPVFVLIRNLMTGRYPSAATRLWFFRPFWYSQLLMLALSLLATATFLLALPFGAGLAAGRWAVFVGAALLVAVGLWGYVGSKRLVVREMVITHPRLPKALDGLRIAQLSDLHVGPQTSRAFLARIARATQDAAPHLIAHTGDQVDDHPADVAHFASAFGALTAPLGVYAIPGNHDVYAGWSEVRGRLEQMGVRVLVNESLPLRHNGAEFWLAGTGDPAGLQVVRGGESGAPDIERTMAGVPPNAFVIALAHNPALFPALARRGAHVVLSGHTHHGQLAIPSRGWSLASPFLEFAMGMHERDGAVLYISPGTNYWGIPFRIGALPEITILTMKRKT